MASHPSQRPLAIITEPLDPVCIEWLSERCTVIQAPPDSSEFNDALPDAQALIVRTYTQVNPALLDRAPELKVVARAGVALENVDRPACAERGITVVHAPAANTHAVVEYVFALMLDHLRPRPTLTEPLDKEQWGAIRKASTAPRQLHGATLAILGLGRIGKRVADVGAALGMNIVFNDIAPVEAPQGAQSVPVEELFERADVLTVHIDDRPSNTLFVGENLLDRMREEVIFINASRGFVLDHDALANFLRNNPNAHAALDVHDPEPVPASNPLLALPNARLLPHIGAATKPAHRNMSWVVRDAWRVLQGETPEHPAVIRA